MPNVLSNYLLVRKTRQKVSSRRVVVGIPVRMASTRFPGKPLEKILGKTMLEHVWQRACLNSVTNEIYVTGCDLPIELECSKIGASYISTDSEITRPGERVFEGLKSLSLNPDDIVVVVQGDEPLLEPNLINGAVNELIVDPTLELVNFVGEISSKAANDPNEIKIVFNSLFEPLYMSRSKIPSSFHSEIEVKYWKQICVFAFTWSSMTRFYKNLGKGELEMAESIELLRGIENSMRFRVVQSSAQMISVDTEEDLQQAELLMQRDSTCKRYL
jgi:3-deoxy-manno-octulosonate cytidylyltransferase (CMP-KDO synthetase)